MEVKGKKIAVLGLGKDGLSLVRSLNGLGAQVVGFGTAGSEQQKKEARDFLGDIPAKLIWEPLSERSLAGSDLVVFSSRSGKFHQARDFAEKQGVPIFSDLDFVVQFLDKPIIGITGTNGKTTTASILKGLLEKGGFKVSNTGGDFDDWGERIADKKKYDFHIFELSSQRLENSSKFSPYIAILLNIFPAHGERHEGGLPAYLAAKAKIFANQGPGDFFIHEASAVNIRELLRRNPPRSQRVMFSLENPVDSPGVFREKNQLIWLGSNGRRETFPLVKAPNKSPTFLMNFMAAMDAALLCGVKPRLVQAVLDRSAGLPNRMEEIRVVNGVKYVNDSRATNLAATLWALYSFNHPIWLIMGGGIPPGSDFEGLNQVSKKRIRTIFLVGSERAILMKKLTGGAPVVPVPDLKEALEMIAKMAEEKDIVLFSPACPPDLFTQGQGTEERGEEFKRLVLHLPEAPVKVRPPAPFSRI